MKLKKLSGFSLGLIALAVGNAYAEQFIQHDEYKHAVAIKDGKVKDWICPYISRHLLSLNPLLACCRRYSR
ncbi:hypothetical protein EXX22_15840, partial [Escherichia coli]|uniref:hypothetical protein n=1 Tax=Escherichia coli TaxID=562 RepID=UPI00102D8C46